MGLQAGGQPMRGGPGQAGSCTQLGEPAGGLGNRVQYPHGFVEHADAAILSHIEIL
jgi:hypothetical protein